MSIQGMRDTSNFVTDGRPKHWRAKVLMLWPNGMAPLYALTSATKSESVDDPEYNWWEKPMQTRRIALGADLDGTGGSEDITTVDSGQTLKEGDLLLVEQTGEILLVNSDPTAATTVNVTRSWGSVAATAVDYDGAAINPNLLVIGSAYEEGSDAPTGVNFDPTKKYNYTQIFRNTLEYTRTASRTRLRTGDAVKEARRECLELHSRDIEWALWTGDRIETTKNSKPIRTTGGVEFFMSSANTKTVSSGNLDMTTLEGYLEEAFAYGSSEKMGFLGNKALTAINTCIRKNSSYEIKTGLKEYGMTVARLVCPHGELVLKTHPLFNQVTGASGSQTYFARNTNLYIMDMSNVIYRYLKGDDTRYQQKLQGNGIDGEKSGYITECGLEMHHPETHFLIKDINAGVADS